MVEIKVKSSMKKNLKGGNQMVVTINNLEVPLKKLTLGGALGIQNVPDTVTNANRTFWAGVEYDVKEGPQNFRKRKNFFNQWEADTLNSNVSKELIL
jgi:hypothetical protein